MREKKRAIRYDSTCHKITLACTRFTLGEETERRGLKKKHRKKMNKEREESVRKKIMKCLAFVCHLCRISHFLNKLQKIITKVRLKNQLMKIKNN